MPDPRVTTTIVPTAAKATFVGRLWLPAAGPRLVAVSGDRLVDVTLLGPTMADLLEREGCADDVRAVCSAADAGTRTWALDEVVSDTASEADRRRGHDASVSLDRPVLLSPVDLQVLKAAGVTFVESMVERVIEERVGGDPSRAAEIRDQLGETIGSSIQSLEPGSEAALAVLDVMRQNGLWSQYLQVGLGTYPEVFTKGAVLSSVGHGWDIGIAAISTWNNPEPELVLVVDSSGTARGATLGNDANLRDIEGASALLLPLAKDNNASAAIGPFVRLFDEGFSLEQAARTTITMRVDGDDGFELEATAPQAEISRSVDRLIASTINRRHQYPDGLVLFCGTPFAPTKDRDAPGMGFTHHAGDYVSISSPDLGTLVNRVSSSEAAPRWDFGIRDLFRSLSTNASESVAVGAGVARS
jgi:fumarylacetoacetate (FAA) hydrolase family protein